MARFSGLETLYAIGALEQRPGEVSIFDSVSFVSEVWNPTETIDSNRVYRAEFLVYTIVERWHRASFHFCSTVTLLGRPVAFSVTRIISMAGT